MYIDAKTIIEISALLAAVTAIVGVLLKVHRWYLKQEEQNKEISHLKTESKMLCECMAACLDGLMQLGANHTVPKAKESMDKYLNEAAHK